MKHTLPLKEAIAELEKQGFKARYKIKCRYKKGKFLTVGNKLKLNADEPLAKGEFWVPVYFNGDDYKEYHAGVSNKVFQAAMQPVEIDPQEAIEYYRDFHKRRSEYVVSGGETVKKSELPHGSGFQIADGSKDALHAHKHLNEAIELIGEDAPKEVWAALFWAFRAGEDAEKCRASKNRQIKIKGEPTGAQQFGREKGAASKLKKWEVETARIWKNCENVYIGDLIDSLVRTGHAVTCGDKYILTGGSGKSVSLDSFQKACSRLKAKLGR